MKPIPIKLNLGCGNELLEGYVNIDLKVPKDTKYMTHELDIKDLCDHYLANSIQEIRLSYVLEHIDYYDVDELLWTFWKLLRPKGRLIITVPNIDTIYTKLITRMIHKENYRVANLEIFGSKTDTIHRTFWNENILRWFLEGERFFQIIKFYKDVGTREVAITVVAEKILMKEAKNE